MKVDVHDFGKLGLCMHAEVPLLPEYYWCNEDGMREQDCTGFCGRPYLIMVLWVNEEKNEYQMRFCYCDEDDFEREKCYDLTKETYRKAAHEGMNWLRDMEYYPVNLWSLKYIEFPEF